MSGARFLGGLMALLLVLAPSIGRAQNSVVSASRGVQQAATSPIEVNLGALPQITPEVAAMHPAAPPLGTGVSAAEYAARKAAANALSASRPTGPAQSTAPTGATGGPETPLGGGFRALNYGCTGTHYYPPDQGLAVNQSYVFEMVNACVAVYDKAGNLQAGFPKSLNAFFGLPGYAFTFDPRAIYDWVNNRFIAIATRYGASIKPQMLVAVSQTGNPMGGWNIYRFVGPAGTGVGDLSDFPQLGQDRLAVYVSFNDFPSASFFSDARVMILPKAAMYAGASVGYAYWYLFSANGKYVDTIQPANEFSPSDHPRAEFLVNSFNINFGGGQCFSSACNGLVVWSISNPLGWDSHSSVAAGVVIGTANNYSLPPAASEISCNNCIDTDDVRISGGVTYHAGSLFGSLNTASGAPGSHVLWFEVKPTLDDNGGGCSPDKVCPKVNGAAVVNEDCYFCGSTGDWYYATLQPDLENNVTMVFHYSLSGNNSPGVAYTSRRATEPPNRMHDNGWWLFTGLTDYTLGSSPRRWGDYTATAPDLTSASSQVWFAGEFSNLASTWRTGIGHNSFNAIKDP